MISKKTDSLETQVKILNHYESIGGAEGVLSLSKTKIDFIDRVNDNGQRVCRLMATMHLGCLNQELYSLAIKAYEEQARGRFVDPSITVEHPIETNGMCYAVLIKDFPSRFNSSSKDELIKYAHKALSEPLNRESQVLKDAIANPGFPGRSLMSSAPFSCSAIINSIAKNKFFRKLAGSSDTYAGDAVEPSSLKL